MNSVFKKQLLLKSLFWISLFILVIVYNDFAREGLPEAKGRGHKDDQSIILFIYGVLLLFATFKTNFLRITTFSLIFLLIIFAVSNWWYYDFYRDYLTPDTLRLAVYAEETTLAWGGLKYKGLALSFLISMFVLLGLYFKLAVNKPGNKALVIIAFLSFMLSAQQQVDASNRALGGLRHHGINHISYFIKNLFPKEKLIITNKHIQHFKNAIPEKKINTENSQYTLFQNVEKSDLLDTVKKNVILIVLESVRMAETGLYANARKSVTPNLDNLAEKSLSFRNHYANSNQTVRGEVAILCSALDYINGSPYSVSGSKLKTNCLPSILKQFGYETYWIHGYKREFFNREEFFPKLGFNRIIDRDVLNVNDDKKMVGWGVADIDLFDTALNLLEKESKPFFAEILTLSNHYPYLWDWDIQFPEHLKLEKELIEGQDSLYPAYKQGVFYTDNALGKFLERFNKSKLYENTLLIVTGDHGIWTFTEELLNAQGTKSELTKNEKYFRLPLIMHSADLKHDVYTKPVSQIDIAPSILDYLSIEYPNAFLGQSLFGRTENGDYPVFFLAAGSYGVRRDKQYCYPVDTSEMCKNYHRKCDSYQSSSAISTCFTTPLDLLESDNELEIVEVDQESDNILIEMTQHFLEYGFMPDDKIM